MAWKFWKNLLNTADKISDFDSGSMNEPKFKIVVADFYDNINSCGAINLAQILNKCEGLEVQSYTENFDHSFLNLESRNIFDLIDMGQSILKQTKAEVIIWGYRNKDKIRLNFQSKNQYENYGNSFVSLMDYFYIPASVLDDSKEQMPSSLLLLLYGAVVSAINNSGTEKQIYKKYLLKKIVNKLSQIDSVQTLGIDYMSYVLNFLGIIYLSLAYESSNVEDFKIIKDLFESALKHCDTISHNTHVGCIYYHLGQLYDCASKNMKKQPSSFFKGAIKNYQTAQKYLSKYTYPYEYGNVCYKISDLYQNYWKKTQENQALRDALFQLREAEKVYTQALFPEFWSKIEGQLGYLLHNLGYTTKNMEICRLATEAYKNQQKIITEKKQPKLWAEIQEKIGDLLFFEGRNENNIEVLQEALSVYHDALYVFENELETLRVKQIKFNISRINDLLSSLQISYD